MPPLIILHSFYYDDQHREYKRREVYVNPNHIVSVELLSGHPNAPKSLVCLSTNCSLVVAETPDGIYCRMEAPA